MKRSNIGAHPALIFDILPSTSSFLKDSSEPAGTLVIARAQSAGRGRRGNGFFSAEGGLYFSMKLPRSMPEDEMWAVTFMAANAVCDALEECGAAPRIKWVNDVYLGGRKVCGILTEVRADSLILGVGINVKRVDMPAQLRSVATSLEEEGILTSADRLLESFIMAFDRYFEKWNLSAVLQRYRPRSLLTGKNICYTENGLVKHATALGIADNGNLICRQGENTFTLHSGEVHTVRNADRP